MTRDLYDQNFPHFRTLHPNKAGLEQTFNQLETQRISDCDFAYTAWRTRINLDYLAVLKPYLSFVNPVVMWILLGVARYSLYLGVPV